MSVLTIKKVLYAFGGGLLGLVAGYFLSILAVALIHLALRSFISSLRANAVPDWERYLLTVASIIVLIVSAFLGGRFALKRAGQAQPDV